MTLSFFLVFLAVFLLRPYAKETSSPFEVEKMQGGHISITQKGKKKMKKS
jgi:hypothetical protein